MKRAADLAEALYSMPRNQLTSSSGCHVTSRAATADTSMYGMYASQYDMPAWDECKYGRA